MLSAYPLTIAELTFKQGGIMGNIQLNTDKYGQ